jgi:hypothetical protein
MRFAVLMRKQFVDNPWISYRWAPQEVMPDFGQFTNAVSAENKIVGQFLGRDDQGESWLFTGYELNLFPDEGEGYSLNLSATQPCWLVMWRLEEDVDRYVDAQSIELAKSEIQNDALSATAVSQLVRTITKCLGVLHVAVL